MTTIITHGIFGGVMSKIVASFLWEKLPRRFWFYSIVAPMIPDLDVASFWLDIPYSSIYGHRGFTHSLAFAAIMGCLLSMFVFFGIKKPFSKEGWFFSFYFFILIASHGVMDAMTNGGLGIAFFWPLTNERYFMPWTPIEVSQIGVRGFFSEWGMRVMLSESIYIIIPCLICLGITVVRSNRYGAKNNQ